MSLLFSSASLFSPHQPQWHAKQKRPSRICHRTLPRPNNKWAPVPRLARPCSFLRLRYQNSRAKFWGGELFRLIQLQTAVMETDVGSVTICQCVWLWLPVLSLRGAAVDVVGKRRRPCSRFITGNPPARSASRLKEPSQLRGAVWGAARPDVH